MAAPTKEPEKKEAQGGMEDKGSGKGKDKDKTKEEELSAEDAELLAKMELLVTRCADPDLGLRKVALASMTTEIRESTSSMTSVPKPLKFLRPHYGTLKETHAASADEETTAMLADILSVLVCELTGKHRPLCPT